MRFLFRTDVHLSDKTPESWKGDYTSEILGSLRQIGALADRYKVEAVLDGGDFFHITAPSSTPHWIVEKAAEIHSAYPCPTYCVVGNHDISYKNLGTLERQPLGVLFTTGVFRNLGESVFEAEGLKVRVVGIPYSPFRTLEELQAIHKQPGDTHLIAVVHALATERPTGQEDEFFRETVFRYRDLTSVQGPDAWLFGHWHKDQGVSEVEGQQFVNPGAVSRGSLARENLERTPQVAILTVSQDGMKVELVPLEVPASHEVFDLERKNSEDQRSQAIEQFAQQLSQSGSTDLSKDVEASISDLEFASDVRSMALEYLQRARELRKSSRPRTG